LFQTLTTDNVTAHSVAVDPTTNNIVVPVSNEGIIVYDLTNSTANATSGSGSSASSGVSKTTIHTVTYIGLALFAGIMLS
jgi:hypothetical protein